MKITVEPTDETMSVNGCEVRVWKGVDEEGVSILALIRSVQPQTRDGETLARFEERLKTLPPIKPVVMTIDYRFID